MYFIYIESILKQNTEIIFVLGEVSHFFNLIFEFIYLMTFVLHTCPFPAQCICVDFVE